MNLDVNALKPLKLPPTKVAGPEHAGMVDAESSTQPEVAPAGSSGAISPDNAQIGSGDVSGMAIVDVSGMAIVDAPGMAMVDAPGMAMVDVAEPEVHLPVQEVQPDPPPILPPPKPPEPTVAPAPVTKPPEVVHTEPPPPPRTEQLITVGGTGMGADKTYKMYPSELAAVYSILRDKGTISPEKLASDLKSYYGIDATVQNGVVVNSGNGHTLIADGNGNGALDMGDLKFNAALQAAGINPTDIGKPGERLLPTSPAETLAALAVYASGYAQKLNEALAHTGTAPEAPNLLPQSTVNDLVKRLKDLMAQEHALLQEAQDLEMCGVPAEVAAKSNARLNEITQQISQMRHNEVLPIAQQLGDYIKAAKSCLGEAPTEPQGAATSTSG